RELHDQPAGLRTHIILVLGATIAMCISINLSMQFHTAATNGDPERLAAQVISGIGFLGAGAIFRYGANVKGLTTAASLWTTAIIGLAVGAGYFVIGGAATACVLFVLVALDSMEKKFLHSRSIRIISIKGTDRPGFVDEVKTTLAKFGIAIKSINLSKDLKNNAIQIEGMAKLAQRQDLDALVGSISAIAGVADFQIRQ
ncbi:MAG TPA: MgtC/SapB family protein, partial [Kiritimatiellia bacterium]|nr:MgtC/SapB family protein [Kiritimatiellia bacterium]